MRARLRSAPVIAMATLVAVGLLATPGSANPRVRSTHQEGQSSDRGSSVSSDKREGHPTSARPGSGTSGSSRSSSAKERDTSRRSPDPSAASKEGLKNTGTVKIAFVGDTTANNNDPHPGCPFRMDLYGFQAGTYAVTVRAHAPTGSGMLTQDSVTLSSSARGNEFQLSRTYDVAAALSSYTPHPQQGYHVRLDVTRSDAGGNGSKTKVFWLECATAVQGVSEEVDGGTDGGTDGTTDDDDTAVLGITATNTDRQGVAVGAAGSDVTPSMGGVLAFTGISLAALLLAALVLMGAGGGLLKGRRASTKG